MPDEVRKEMVRLRIKPSSPKKFTWGTVEIDRRSIVNFGFLLKDKKEKEYKEIHKLFSDQHGDEKRTGVIIINGNDTVSVYEYTPEDGLLLYHLNKKSRRLAEKTARRLIK